MLRGKDLFRLRDSGPYTQKTAFEKLLVALEKLRCALVHFTV